jgi:periplasmic protein TonB
MPSASTPAKSSERRLGSAKAMLLALSILLHVLALEVLLLATAGGGRGSRSEVQADQPIDAVFWPATAAGGAAAKVPATAAEQRAAKERQAMLDRLVQPTAIPDAPGPPANAAPPGASGGPSALKGGAVANAGAPQASEPAGGAALPADAGGDITRPDVIESSRILPDYPEAAQRAGREGVVVIKAIIDEEGRVTHPEVLRSLDPILDDAALAAVRRWKFRPATRFGKPVRVNYILTVDFRL